MADVPAYRVFKSIPLPSFHEQIRAHIREHAQPELILDLRHEPIDKDEYFEILCEIDLEGKKRPEGDMAPCPMCQPNKFLRGRLCYFPRLQCCAIIGHCCANKEHTAEAERRYKDKSVLKWQEDYLLAAMPLIPKKLQALSLMSVRAEEALRLHQKFRKQGNQLMKMLRDATRDGGRLQVHFEIEKAMTGTGPAGFGGKDRVFDTKDYGALEGSVAIRAKYDPVEELDHMTSALQVWNVGSSDEAVFNAIVTMNERQRSRGYAVLTDIDHKKWPSFVQKIEDFNSFFEAENLDRLNAWGQDARNPFHVGSGTKPIRGLDHLRQVELVGAGRTVHLVPDPCLGIDIPEWKVVPKKRAA